MIEKAIKIGGDNLQIIQIDFGQLSVSCSNRICPNSINNCIHFTSMQFPQSMMKREREERERDRESETGSAVSHKECDQLRHSERDLSP